MDRKKISIILLAIFVITLAFTAANALLGDSNTSQNQTGTIQITDSATNNTKTVHYEKSGECLRVIDGDTIWVYGVGNVRLVQVDAPEKNQAGFSEAKKFVEDSCLSKTVYLDIDDREPKDDYDRALAIVYADGKNINRELLNKGLAKELYIPPSEFEKGQI